MIHYRILDRNGDCLHSSKNRKHFDGWLNEQSAIDVAISTAQANTYSQYKIQIQRKNSPFWEDVHNTIETL